MPNSAKRKLDDTRIVDAAIAWWIDLRPEGWSEYRHLLNPTVNTHTQVEMVLAQYVADEMKRRHNLRRIA